jgi:histidinol dehydrogenase
MRRLDTREPDFEARFCALIAPAEDAGSVADAVREILRRVQKEGDAAVVDYTNGFDRVQLGLSDLRVTPEEVANAASSVAPELAAALALAARRIEAFHRAQLPADTQFTDEIGATLGLRWTAIDAVGLYVPGGKASYPSSVLMNAIPARVAGVKRIAMCVPAPDGVLNPLVLAAARLAGVSEIYRIGGAQAVAALAYGTALIDPVDRIVGPGNAYVAEAKRQVFGRVGIDNIAGPSEVLIIADATASAQLVALDLLAQAEHDEAARVLLCTDDAALADEVAAALERELAGLARGDIAAESLRRHGAIILVRDLDEAADLANRVATEHLQLITADPAALFGKIRHAGAAFLGAATPTAMGDYIAGPNHVLPTGGTARFASGLSVYDFLKRTTWVELTREAAGALAPAAQALATAEGLGAHASSLALRRGNA